MRVLSGASDAFAAFAFPPMAPVTSYVQAFPYVCWLLPEKVHTDVHLFREMLTFIDNGK